MIWMPRLRNPVSIARVVCGSQSMALEISLIVLPYSCESISITFESLELFRGMNNPDLDFALKEVAITPDVSETSLSPDAVSFRL